MALKYKKYPKKPGVNATLAQKQKYLDKVAEIDAINRQRYADNVESAKLTEAISGLGSTTDFSKPGKKMPRKKRGTGKKSTGKKSTRKKKRKK